MPPVITCEEAHRLGEIEDRAGIEALVERARQARVGRFAEATDGRPTREHEEAALAGGADDGHGGPRR